MSEQTKNAGKFMRDKLGADKVDAIAPLPALRLVGPGEIDLKNEDNWVELPGGGRQLSAFARDIGRILSNAPVFLREGVVMKVVPRSGKLEVVSDNNFRTLVEDYTVTYKSRFYKQGKDTIEEKDPSTMTTECAKGTLQSDQFKSCLRRVARVNTVPMPVMRDDGKIELLAEGYDETTETLTINSGVKIKEDLTPDEGKAVIEDYLSDFPFTGDGGRSKAVAVAQMVALFVHGLQELTANRMGFVTKSNKERSGKSLVTQAAIAGPYGLPKGQTISNQEEMKKLLDATALQAEPYLFFDNLTGNIKSNLLESFMTTPVWTGRVMGTQKTFEAPKGTIVLITGNNITTSADIAGRCLLCVLFTEEADPQARKLKRIFTAQSLARPQVRGDLLSALWALVRGWDKAGRPNTARRIAGFEEWVAIVGGIVMAAGFVDPCQKPKDEDSTNTQEVDARELVKQLVFHMGSSKLHEFTFQELVDVCYEHKCFDWKLDGKIKGGGTGPNAEPEWFECNKASSSALGRVFGTDMAGQIYGFQDEKGVVTRVRFGKRGNNRHRKYSVEVLPPPAPEKK